jgi:hypothetical protein
MVSLWNGYKTWTMQSVLTEKQKDKKQAQLNAALGAEDQIAAILREAGLPVFLRKRVFVAEANHNREIDVIAIADKVLVIEVKNWSGSVWRNGFRWYQLPPRSSQPLEFEDIFSESKYKTESLRRHLENDHKIHLPQEQEDLVSCVVFTHPNVKLDPDTVANLPYVFNMNTFRAYVQTNYSPLSRAGLSVAATHVLKSCTRWAWSLVPVLGASKPQDHLLDGDTKERIHMALDSVRTWDTVVLHNGTLIHGDVMGVECPSAACAYLRHHLVGIVLRWSDPSLLGLVGSLWNGTAGTVELLLSEAKKKPKKKEQKPRQGDGNVMFPIIQPKSKTDLMQVDRILMKRAGTPRAEPIVLTNIRTIELSKHMQANPKMVAV